MLQYAVRRCSLLVLVMLVFGLVHPVLVQPVGARASQADQRLPEDGSATPLASALGAAPTPDALADAAFPSLLTAQSAPSVLLVVGGTPPLAAGTGDRRVEDELLARNYSVVVKNQSVATTADATGKDLVIISSTVSAGTVGTKFRDVAVPVLTWETALYAPMNMTDGSLSSNNGAGSPATTNLTITNPSHPLAAGLSSTVAIFSTAQSLAYGTPSSTALKIAPLGASTSMVVYFAYDIGASMVGLTAPARRIGFFFNQGFRPD